jgi:hypothetical protein
MSAPWSFSNLNLSDVNAQRATTGLPIGKHVCVVNDAEIKKSRSGFQIAIVLEEIEGLGICKDYITLHSESNEENFKLAERIGKERFKALLECAEHPNPNNPGDINSIVGLVVGVICEQDEDWTDQHGVIRAGGVKPRRNGAYIKASTLGYAGPLKVKVSTRFKTERAPAAAKPRAMAPAGADLDDDIPF